MYAATPTAWDNVVTVKLTDGNNDTYQSRFGASPELTGAASWGAVTTNLEGATVRAYVTLGGVNYEQLYLNAMENVALKVKTYNSTSLTIKLTANEGSATLYDKETKTETKVTKGGAEATKEYVCTVAANTTIEDRFVLFYAPAAPAICFNYNVLEINGHAGETLKVMQGTTEIVPELTLGDTYSKDLSDQSGRLVVILNGTEYQIDANPAVTEVP